MAGMPFGKFFWSDWAGDPLLLLCSPSAQALWMRLLCIAAESSLPGHVLLNGKKPTIQELHDITRFPVDAIPGWLEEIISRGVCDVTRAGVMVNRRMVRDTQKHRRNSSGGRVAAAITPRNEKGIYTGRSDRNQRQSPESRIQSPEADSGTVSVGGPGTLEKALSKAQQLCEAIGESLTADVTKANWPLLIERILAEGITFDALLLAARTLKAAGRLPDDGVRTPMFFKSEALKLMRQGMGARAPVQVVVATAPALSERDWNEALKAFVIAGAWIRSEWGPSPCEAGCKAPPDMLERARARWEQQGNHPSGMHQGNALVEWKPNDPHSLMQEPKPFYRAAA